MNYYLLLILVPGAAFVLTCLTAAACAATVWPLIEHRTRRSSAARRARVVATLRLAPLAAGVLAAAVVSAAFVRFEPADTAEAPGVLLWLGAAILGAMCSLASVRIARAVAAGARCSRLLRLGARMISRPDGTRLWIVDSQYPVAAVIGIFQTRLLLSNRLVRECTESELDAIVSHERAHIRRRDNLVRAAMLYLPDPLAPFTAARQMEAVWAAAAEESADDAAAGEARERRTVLASALVRVAKMATTPLPEWVGGLAFYEGHNLENRVRRLLDAGNGSPPRGFAAYGTIATVLVSCALLMTEAAGQQLHAWLEIAVQVMP